MRRLIQKHQKQRTGGPAIPSSVVVAPRRHPSRLPCGSLRSALTGPVGDAEKMA
jgi:hypothetical protein